MLIGQDTREFVRDTEKFEISSIADIDSQLYCQDISIYFSNRLSKLTFCFMLGDLEFPVN